MIRSVLASLLAALPLATLAQAQPEPASGYLCCNMRTDGSWISDMNYADPGKRVIPLGTPVTATGYGRYRVHVEFPDGKQAIGNDFSRDLSMTTFAQRYVVAEDPKKKLAGLDPKVRKAIDTGRLMSGMTREQVLMSVGYPVSSENPRLDAAAWRYWLSGISEFQVRFGPDDRVKDITIDPMTRHFVVLD